MIVTISNVEIQSKGKFSIAVVNYTTSEGKAEKKNVASYEPLYPTLSKAGQGENFDVQFGKNDRGYWEFKSATKVEGGAAAPRATPTSGGSSPTPAPRSNFETPEERAARQVYIVRQSSLSNATAILSVGAKSVEVKDVLAVAKQLEDFVFGKATPATAPEFFDNSFVEDIPSIE
jgi:hypothetical protein